MAFPYSVDFASDTWVDRIIATTVLGLVCWLISGIVHVVALYKRKSRKSHEMVERRRKNPACFSDADRLTA